MFDEESAVTTIIVLVIFVTIGSYVMAFILPTALSTIATTSAIGLTDIQTITVTNVLPIIIIIPIVMVVLKMVFEFRHDELGAINMERRYNYEVDEEQIAFESEILDMHDFFSKDT